MMFLSRKRRKARKSSKLRRPRLTALLGLETLEHRRVLAAYINEFQFAPRLGDQTTDQYIEIRGEPGGQLNPGTFFVGIESAEGVNDLGDIHTVINLSNQQLGANGTLVLLQSGSGYAVDPNSRVLQGADGFQGIPGFAADNDATTIHTGSGTYLLIESIAAPTLLTDIDTNDNGLPDGPYATWDILDGFAVLPWVESVFEQRTYAPIVFRDSGVGDSHFPFNATRVDTDSLGYVGRIGNSTGFNASDWLAGWAEETAADSWDFKFTHGASAGGVPRPVVYGGRSLDHVGAPNWQGSVTGVVFRDDNGDGVQAQNEPGLAGVPVVADFDANGLQGHFWETIEPNDYAIGDDLTNISSNATLITAGSANEHIQFKTRAAQAPNQGAGENVFAHEGVSFHNNNRRLRIDFYRPARTVSIDVIGNSDLTDTYGRLEIFNSADQSLGFVLTNPLAADERETLSMTTGQDEIAYAVAYSDENVNNNSSPFGRLDTLRFELREISTVTDANGNYSIAPLTRGAYEVTAIPGTGYNQVFPVGGGGHNVNIVQYENLIDQNFGLEGDVPPNLEDTELMVGENLGAAGVIGQLPVTLGYSTQELTFTTITGDLTGLFSIDPATFEVILNRDELDFETLTTYTFEVELADTSNSALKDTALITITVTDENDAPVVGAQQQSVDENTADGTVVATMSATDQDPGQAGTFLFSIVGGNTDNTFEINANSGVVSIRDNAGLDFETNPVFNLTIRATDGGNPTGIGEANLEVQLGDVNEAPNIPDQEFDVVENAEAGTLVGQLNSLEPDAGQTAAWSVNGGTGQGLLDVSLDGQITVADGAVLDFETTPTLTLDVQVSDSGTPVLSANRLITISLIDINDPPTLLPQQFSVDENSDPGTVVGTVAAQDEDAGQSVTFAITGGDDASLFDIDAASGQITVASAADINFESKSELIVEVTATDDHSIAKSSTAAITISVNDINEPPVITIENFSVPENSPAGTVVGTVQAADPDANDSIQFSLPSQTANWLQIDGASGQLTVIDGANIDFEGTSQTVATVRVADGQGLATEAQVTVTASDANDPPIVASPLADTTAEEGTAFNLVIPESTFTDEDAGDSLSYVATSGDGFSLPDWLSFDPNTRTLSGTPGSGDLGVTSVRVSAVDSAGAAVADTFDIDVQEGNSWHNETEIFDVNDDTFVTPIDALMVINYLNTSQSPEVPDTPPTSGLVDVNNDGFVTPIDALIVINRLNRGEGEGEFHTAQPQTAGYVPANNVQDDEDEEEESLVELLALDPNRL